MNTVLKLIFKTAASESSSILRFWFDTSNQFLCILFDNI